MEERIELLMISPTSIELSVVAATVMDEVIETHDEEITAFSGQTTSTYNEFSTPNTDAR
jgi:hypothetical protein